MSSQAAYDGGGQPLLGSIFNNPLLWGSFHDFGQARRGGWFEREPEPEQHEAPKDYFTSPELLKIIKGQNPGKPVAVHVEDTGDMWSLGLDNPGKAEPPNKHGMVCAAILRGAADGNKESFLGYQMDADPYTRDTLARVAANPAVKVMTISMVKGINEDNASRLPAADRLTILAAAGNFGDDERTSGVMRTAGPVHYAPGFLRVGEVDPNGMPSAHSNADGPAFMCENPLTKRDLSAQFYPTIRELQAFQMERDGDAYDARTFARYFPTQETQGSKEAMQGTSFATPEAGRMIMHATANFDGIKNYDVIPAVLLAAQMSAPPTHPIGRYGNVTVAQVTNGAGLRFGTLRYGFGVLKEDALAEKIKRVWELRAASPATVNGQLSDPQIVDAKTKTTRDGYGNDYTMKVDAGRQGTIVNTTLSLTFNRAGGAIPIQAEIESPSGTKLTVPLIYKERLGASREAIAVTPAFFGEKKMDGDWKISLPDQGNSLVAASISFATLKPGSPGAQLLDEFKAPQETPPRPQEPRYRPIPQPQPRYRDPFDFFN